MEKHTVSWLIGAPPGYVGYDEGGQLTEAVRRRPYRVVLFDEIEKAHPDVFNVLLPIMEDGRLTDGHGRTVDFRNVGTTEVGRPALGFRRGEGDMEAERQKLRTSIEEALKKTFRPEFLNRIDEVVIFDSLTQDQIEEIVGLMMGEVSKRLAERGVTAELTPAAREWLAKEGFDPVFGARPLRRALQGYVENPLSKGILAGEFPEGSHVIVDGGELGLAFNKAKAAVGVEA